MKRFKFKYTGGLMGAVILTVLTLTIILIPAAVIALIEDIEIIELP